MKASHKRLKVILALGVRKLDPFSLILKLDEFPLFDDFFPDLADFWELDNFWSFNNFSIFSSMNFSIDLPPSSIIPILLVANTLFVANTRDDTIVFNINVSGVAILLKS